MTQESPTISTTFWLEGDGLDPDEFTRLVGIEPTRTTRKGELSPHLAARAIGRKSPTTVWAVNFERQSYSMNEDVQEVLAIIWEQRDKILEYLRDKPDVTVGMTSAIHIYEDRPVYDLSRDTIHKLAYMGAQFGIDDVYDYRTEEQEDGEANESA